MKPWEDESRPLRERVRELLDAARSRGEVKRLGAWLDDQGDELKAMVADEGRRRGGELPDDAPGWPGKRLLRAALAREDAARVVGNPTRVDEAFLCAWCGLDVPPHGRTARDHCPRCLRSLHVDVVPGDRAADCGGVLRPVGLELRHGEPVIRYRCDRCGAEKVNRAATDGDVPDDAEALRRLSRGEDPSTFGGPRLRSPDDGSEASLGGKAASSRLASEPDVRRSAGSRSVSGPGRLRHRVGETIARRGLWSPGDRVAVAVSGGMDSVCLLDLLVATQGWHQGVLSVVTVDHGTRPTSAGDADFVVSLAASLGLPVVLRTLSLGPDASEDACRAGRYGVFEELDVDRVAVAHHEHDQAETVLLQLLRGTGIAGLAGMGWRRGRIVRPLLDVPRSDLREWAAHRDLRWVEDPTNDAPAFLRNRVRKEVLPLLEDLRPGAARALARTATLVADDAEWLAAEAAERLPLSEGGWDREALAAAPPALARRAILGAVPGLTSASADAILDAARRGPTTVELPGNRRANVTMTRVTIAGAAPVAKKATDAP